MTMWNEPTKDELAGIPLLYTTESIGLEDKLIHMHFFLGSCDWYAAEYDRDDRLFFGYAILNDDFQNAEWGYFAYDELRSIRIGGGIEIDRDLHWRVRPARDVERIARGMEWYGA